jgi:hypothetical protein
MDIGYIYPVIKLGFHNRFYINHDGFINYNNGFSRNFSVVLAKRTDCLETIQFNKNIMVLNCQGCHKVTITTVSRNY